MARRNSKIEPAIQTIACQAQLVAPGATETYTLDLSQIASLVNRRFYRQGLNWAVAGFKIITSVDDAVIGIDKLPNTWIMGNSWEKSMRTWMRMNNEALSETDSVRPRFLDFKIYADPIHHQAGYAANLLPVDGSNPANVYVSGEWSPSKISVPLVSPAGVFNPGETVERELIAVGPSYPGVSAATGLDAVSLIEGYASSRGLPNIADPNTPDDASDIGGGTPENWMQAIFNEGTDQASDIIEDMITENTIAPYPFEGGNDPRQFLPSGAPNPGYNLPFPDTMYPGGANQAPSLQVHDIARVTGTTLSSTVRLKGGNFPCGLVRINYTNVGDGTASFSLMIDLVPGQHRGYLCEPMTEM